MNNLSGNPNNWAGVDKSSEKKVSEKSIQKKNASKKKTSQHSKINTILKNLKNSYEDSPNKKLSDCIVTCERLLAEYSLYHGDKR